MSFSTTFASCTEIGKRKVQQDDLITTKVWNDSAYLFAVFDGHGSYGHIVSAYCKNHFPDLINKSMNLIKSNPEEALTAIFKEINDLMNDDESVDTYMSGTTAVVVIIYDKIIISANVGDSKAILSQKDDNIVTLSFDHTCEITEEYDRIVKGGGRIEQMVIDGVPDGPKRIYKGSLPYPGLVVSRALGDNVASKIGVLCIPFVKVHYITEKDNLVIMGSDGLWDGISEKDAVKIVTPYIDLDVGLASTILNDAGLAGLDKLEIDDNITNILILLK